MKRSRWGLALALAGIAAVTAACGGGGGSSAVSTQQPSMPFTNGAAVLTIPNGATASGSRRAQYVSAASVSVGVAVNGGAATFSNIAAGSSLCTPVSNGRTCTIPLSLPPGSDSVVFTLYDAANGGGNVLGSSTVMQTVVSGTPFTISVVVNGVISNIALSTGSQTLTVGTSSTVQITVTAKDSDGNTIIAPGNFTSPITITDNDTSGATSLILGTTTKPSPTVTVTAPSQTVVLTYNGGLSAGATFAVSGTVSVGPNAVSSTLLFQVVAGSSGTLSCNAPAATIPGTYTTVYAYGTFSGTTFTANTSQQFASGWDSYSYTAATPAPSPSVTTTPSPGPSPTRTPQAVYLYEGTYTLQSGTTGCLFLITSQDGSALTILNGSSQQGYSGETDGNPSFASGYNSTFVAQGPIGSLVINNLSASGGSGSLALNSATGATVDSGTIVLTGRVATTLDEARNLEARVRTLVR